MSEAENEAVEPVEPAAEVVEPDDDDDDVNQDTVPEPDEDEAATEDVPPPAEGLASEADIEKAQKSLTRLREHVAKRMGDIFGDDAPLYVPCAICGETTPGFMLPPQLAPPDDETIAVLRAYLGMDNLEEYNQAKDAKRCQDCNGKGWVRTDSDVPNFEVKKCSLCVGKGYVGTGIFIQPEIGETTNGTAEYVAASASVPVESALPPDLQQYKERGYLIVPPQPSGTG